MCRGFCTVKREQVTVKTCGFCLEKVHACNEQRLVLYTLKEFTSSTLFAVPWCHCDDGSCCTAYPSESKSSLLCSWTSVQLFFCLSRCLCKLKTYFGSCTHCIF
ncbi:hypothetical protein MTO96_011979 [Rhipicephalus appendiculatus]